ncbi:MAG: hypothetical protein KJ634_03905 [Gammaproteobacteria bacterium]|nr:hypothetical protein [Gammaproteobacteria bacterium]MBU1414748.1 hypothetical protein [Gammaproteobacteria bacterium]
MYRAFARSRLALTLRRLRGRFGIAAPRVAVRTHVAWHWRVLTAVVVLGLALALGGWIYDAGRRYAGFDRQESESEISFLRDKVQHLEAEMARLRSIANTSESRMQIDRATVEQLTAQVRVLEEEKTHLKESLAVFENLAAGGGNSAGVSLGGLRIEPDATPGRYRYRVLASIQGAEARREFKGSLQFQITVLEAGGQSAIIVLPRSGDPDAGSFSVAFRAFRSLEGSFRIPVDATIKRVEARLVQNGAIVASQSASL